ncbi:hypothetical protein P171DRAFT_445005 [Karstenula rhodostoma CBS 690.94]|uniref:Uncharacterized protein n=1 Tax=Karstenula rhodostoma CBS 690.94 TaxID=1392251 RepID=A0A9P4PI68_9PLEO|nr:hypothetical protein P171DRAFT_445005 [Karstenula rhodostoma CBS 690.94]
MSNFQPLTAITNTSTISAACAVIVATAGLSGYLSKSLATSATYAAENQRLKDREQELEDALAAAKTAQSTSDIAHRAHVEFLKSKLLDAARALETCRVKEEERQQGEDWGGCHRVDL